MNRTGNTCDIIRETVDTIGSEEAYTESTIYSDIKCYILKVNARDFTQELAHETDKSKMLIKVGKKTDIEKGDLVNLKDKDIGDMGRYRVEEVEPKRLKGRLKSVYLYIKKYND
jgi:hypothetical protein